MPKRPKEYLIYILLGIIFVFLIHRWVQIIFLSTGRFLPLNVTDSEENAPKGVKMASNIRGLCLKIDRPALDKL